MSVCNSNHKKAASDYSSGNAFYVIANTCFLVFVKKLLVCSPYFWWIFKIKWTLGCPVFRSKFLFDCSPLFSAGDRWKNDICKVSMLKIQNCDYTSHLKFEKSPFFDQKWAFSGGLCSLIFECMWFFIFVLSSDKSQFSRKTCEHLPSSYLAWHWNF